MKGQKAPYTKLLKHSVTIRLDQATIDYFNTLVHELGVPYQSVINLYWRDRAMNRRKPNMEWG